MSDKNWLAEIWVGDEYTECVTVYAGTLAELRETAAGWLRANTPTSFTNGSPITTDLDRRYSYFYRENHKFKKPGWVYVTGKHGWGDDLADFEAAVNHFANTAILPQKGPEYIEKPLTVDGSLALHLVRSVTTVEADRLVVNDLIQCGWRIIALDYKTSSSYREEPTARHTIFIMGHPEEDAA